MASIFDSIGSGLQGLFGADGTDRFAIAQAMVNGDYGAAANIRAKQAREAQDILGFMDGLVIKAQDALNSQIASEELGQPMKMDGAKLSIAKDEAH